jgi:hypothetical protein
VKGAGSHGRRAAAAVLVVLVLLACAGSASARSQTTKQSALNPIAAAVAEKFAKTGASYLVTQLQNGALGSTGTTIGNLLGPFVQDPSVATQAQIEEIRAQLEGMQQGIGDVKQSLSQLAKDITDAQFSLSVQHAARIISLIDRSIKDLSTIAQSSSLSEREQVKADLIARLGPTGGLDAAQESLRNYLVSGVPGAQGILESALKKVRGSAQPFITNELANGPEQVYKYYTMYQALLFDLRINYLRAKSATEDTIKRELDSFNADLGSERSVLKQFVWKSSALDPRTWILWSAGSSPIRGKWDSLLRWYGTKCCTNLSVSLANSYGGFWQLPTVDQLRSLVKDAGSPAAGWLAQRADFPSGVGPWVWAGEKTGCPNPQDPRYTTPACHATVFNLDTGQVEERSATDAQIGLVMLNDYYVQASSYRYP